METMTDSYQELMDRLAEIPELIWNDDMDMCYVSNPVLVTKIQNEMLAHDLAYSGVVMLEGTYCDLSFSNDAHAPDRTITIRYIVDYEAPDGTFIPPVALMYYEGINLKHYVASGRTAPNTHGEQADLMRRRFDEQHPGVESFWLPAFPQSPLMQD